jgi:hypothetical protein
MLEPYSFCFGKDKDDNFRLFCVTSSIIRSVVIHKDSRAYEEIPRTFLQLPAGELVPAVVEEAHDSNSFMIDIAAELLREVHSADKKCCRRRLP